MECFRSVESLKASERLSAVEQLKEQYLTSTKAYTMKYDPGNTTTVLLDLE
jgi:hypothetical protein